MNRSENATQQNLQDPAKAVSGGKFVAMQEIRKSSNKQSNFTCKGTRKRVTKPSSCRRKEIKIRAEINKIETKKTIAKIHEKKSWFFEKTNKTDQHLTRLSKNKGERTQIKSGTFERGKIQLIPKKYEGS